jgi:hypothetical protein
MKRVAGYEMVSIEGETAEKHAAIPENNKPATNERGSARSNPTGEASPSRRRMMLIDRAEIKPLVAPQNISPRITS